MRRVAAASKTLFCTILNNLINSNKCYFIGDEPITLNSEYLSLDWKNDDKFGVETKDLVCQLST